TDDNCASPNHFCVPMQYDGLNRPGGYCLKTNQTGCMPPFSIGTAGRTSLSGAADLTFCSVNEISTTCEAVRALLDDQQCPDGTDDECPEGGICRQVGDLLNRCTYACSLASHCPGDPPANTCGQGMPANEVFYCGG